ISQEQALELVQKWYAAKPRIFAPPFDRDLLNELATGKLYQKVGGEDGSIDWLQKYNRYYTYNKSAITNIMGFSNSGSRPYIKVRVVEELYLQGEKGIDKTNSGEYQIDYIYFFAKDNGTWKIYNNEKISDAG
ncbi:MAG: ARC6/PARC6 family protein, partial [Dolichospermum sp.]